jgi:hypothetical protein
VRKLILITVLLTLPLVCFGQDAATQVTPKYEKQPIQKYLERYNGKEKIPDELYLEYKELMEAFSSQDQDRIKQHCLPYSITFSVGGRPEATKEYGKDINIPFLKTGFNPDILSVRRDSDNIYLLRTGSSVLWFVKTENEGWKLYNYLDKPIE